MQGTRVWSLVQEDSKWRGTTKPGRYNSWACTLEPVLCHRRSRPSEKSVYRNKEQPLLAATRESPWAATKTQCNQNKLNNDVRKKKAVSNQQAFVSTSMQKSLTNFTSRTPWVVPDSDQSRSRGDLISERISNLGSSKRQLSLVEFQKPFEIQENPLCSFWSQISINLNKSVCYKGRNHVSQ